ncbi:MAG: hypothetical protein HY055_03095 [Magnetospirillum sp.]|nr:hypothetical protein [Magnetospirillum sp.]
MNLSAEAPQDASPRSIAVVATGESMVPAKIYPGDIVIFDGGKDGQPGQITLVELKTGTAAIKKFGGYDGEWAIFEGWLPPEDGAQTPYVDRRRRDQINRILPMVAVQSGFPGLDQAAERHPVRVEADALAPMAEMVPSAVTECLNFLASAGKDTSDAEPVGDLCGIAVRLMLAPELDGAPIEERRAAVRRHLEAFRTVLDKPFWRRLFS